jgi:hypothetical protein
MDHPETNGSAVVTQKAFDDLWAPKGWVLVDPGVSVPDIGASGVELGYADSMTTFSNDAATSASNQLVPGMVIGPIPPVGRPIYVEFDGAIQSGMSTVYNAFLTVEQLTEGQAIGAGVQVAEWQQLMPAGAQFGTYSIRRHRRIMPIQSGPTYYNLRLRTGANGQQTAIPASATQMYSFRAVTA